MAINHDGYKVYRDGHSNENVKNSVLLRNRQIHGEFTVIPSSENTFVAVIVIVCGRHGLWPSLSNPLIQLSTKLKNRDQYIIPVYIAHAAD